MPDLVSVPERAARYSNRVDQETTLKVEAISVDCEQLIIKQPNATHTLLPEPFLRDAASAALICRLLNANGFAIASVHQHSAAAAPASNLGGRRAQARVELVTSITVFTKVSLER